MKKVVLLVVILFASLLVLGQDKPVTQAEYVKMLYSLQKAPAGKTDIIESLRKRGIDFALTDGIRSLTRSKGANDEDLKRALDKLNKIPR